DSVLLNYNNQLFQRVSKNKDMSEQCTQFVSEIPQKELRITIMNTSGKVLYDNTGDASKYDNHINRTEVRKALDTGKGNAIRDSDTNKLRYFYSASRLGGYIIRTALPYNTYVRDELKTDKGFIYFMATLIVLFIFVLLRYTRSIGRTISELRDFAQNIKSEESPEKIAYKFPNNELGDISQLVVSLYNKQVKAKKELSIERDKIMKHFKYSKEGFGMFKSDGKEILSNILFLQMANVISDKSVVSAEDVLTIPEFGPLYAFLSKGMRNTEHRDKVLRDTLTIDKNGKIYQIKTILFLDNSYEISINDISRMEEESRLKRQLTQNVAHELKTPVSSIQGYLETILANPNLDAEKMRFFLERCFSQSTRLADLLRDISVLNRMEEATEMFDLSDINISNMVHEIVRECGQQIEAKHIKTDISLQNNLIIHGNHSLLYSIFRNLFDNAIAYAGDNITIEVACFKEDESYYYFKFSDSGCGVQDEHLNRLFERFYRVDKGRSRKIGGTGLGLAIVKNGVNFHKGEISAKNRADGGLEFIFTLKKKISHIS
ncbi:MAG: ATP-binding protein, partial [Tannerellaceae bacterium]